MADNLSCARLFCKLMLVFVLVIFGGACAFAKDSPVNRLQSPIAKHITIDALIALEKGNWKSAHEMVANSKDPLASKLFNWLLLLNMDKHSWTDGLFLRLMHFIRQNEEWPEVNAMKVKVERVMPEDFPYEDVVAWYDGFSPKTSHGFRRYMDALLAMEQEQRAYDLLIEWWSDPKISIGKQKQILSDYGHLLPFAAHKRRFDALLHDGHYSSALDVAKILGHGYPELARARIALAKNRGRVGDLIDRVPEDLQGDAGLLYERLRWRRKRGLDEGALEILRAMPPSDHIVNLSDWWRERHIMIRRLLAKRRYDEAYELASTHIQREGGSYAQAQWLAGWLALYFMDQPTEAYERFTVLFSRVKTPISKARASYWAGRGADALKQKKLAQRWYKTAADFQTTFYGQLAGSVLSIKERLPSGKAAYLSARDRENYKKSELLQASNLFRDAKQDRRAEQFLNAFLQAHEDAKAYRFVAEMLAERGDYHGAVKISKRATRKGLFLTKQSYPTITKHLVDINSAEWALIHAIIRQESTFDYKARSPAGALGLMQLLPSTARETAGKLKIGYKKAWLTERPQYNIILGAAYIGRLLSYYDGNYPLAIAAYNAGPGRVDSWIKTYGDPRKDEISLIDWIELIPIYETRNYVQRVLENIYVYRLRLKDVQNPPAKPLYVAFQ